MHTAHDIIIKTKKIMFFILNITFYSIYLQHNNNKNDNEAK